jgi:lysophospholipid acyltransferase (LPLAT)-like uncharacterized protein
MRWSKRVLRHPFALATAGFVAASYLRLVAKTNSKVFDPPDIYDRIAPELPVIIALWHGEHLISWFFRRPDLPGHNTKVLISRHRDGEINAQAVERLGIVPIRGSGAHAGEFHRKGGVPAFKEMLTALNEGWNVVLTADVPKVSRVAGLGIVKLAQHSGRAIYPISLNTSRRKQLSNWDRTIINLPFGRMSIVGGNPIRVPRDADDAALEAARKQVEHELNLVSARAQQIADHGAAVD